jgi:hypothetical protein
MNDAHAFSKSILGSTFIILGYLHYALSLSVQKWKSRPVYAAARDKMTLCHRPASVGYSEKRLMPMRRFSFLYWQK